MHNDHVITFYRFRVFVCEQNGYWMAREFYADWANREMERQHEQPRHTRMDRSFVEQGQERRSIPTGVVEEA